MIRFILHSLLILVVTQLTNVAMGLVMTESQRTAITSQIFEIHDSIKKAEAFDLMNPNDTPVLQTPLLSMRRSELPCRVRVMLDGIPSDKHESPILNPETDYTGTRDVFVSQPERYFHELCLLII
ncbi:MULTISPECIES: hypothetical protein [Butyricimonas]|uniref:hypothetical protein n=1 Tax=Butyricimonas TaxID=574697 RepID=UPI0007FB3FBD|nr:MULTISPECIES: hypothetical protein [Butyricimonas]